MRKTHCDVCETEIGGEDLAARYIRLNVSIDHPTVEDYDMGQYASVDLCQPCAAQPIRLLSLPIIARALARDEEQKEIAAARSHP